MKKMGPDEFVEMLRSAIKQDEWLLFLHGGALGLFAASSTWRSLECDERVSIAGPPAAEERSERPR